MHGLSDTVAVQKFIVFVCLLFQVIASWVLTCDNAHPWQLYSAALLGSQAITTLDLIDIPSTHIILTLSQPVLVISI